LLFIATFAQPLFGEHFSDKVHSLVGRERRKIFTVESVVIVFKCDDPNRRLPAPPLPLIRTCFVRACLVAHTGRFDSTVAKPYVPLPRTDVQFARGWSH
jgi:hypothetical protein